MYIYALYVLYICIYKATIYRPDKRHQKHISMLIIFNLCHNKETEVQEQSMT